MRAKHKRKKIFSTVRFLFIFQGLFLIICFLIACRSFNYVVRVQDRSSSVNIEGAKVTLIVSELPPLVKFTDSEGVTILQIDSSREGQIGQLIVSADGYKDYTRTFEIRSGELPTLFKLETEDSSQESVAIIEDDTEVTELPNEATSTPTLSREPVTPSSTATLPSPTVTYIDIATETATPTSLPTATTTSTQTPTLTPATPTESVTLTRREGSDTVYVLAGPDVNNVQLGTLAKDEIAQVVGRTEQTEWIQIVTSRGIEGWVALCEVEIVNGSFDTIDVTWEGNVTARNCIGNGTTVSPSCLSISLDHTDWPGKEFDDIQLNWLMVPPNTSQLFLKVTGIINGESAYVVHPTYSDTNTPYTIELWMFEDGGFQPDTTFTYYVEAQNESSEPICSVTGTFEQ